ncbi:MAG: SDR family oxidoreductase [bacterium]|nr:SDR family oxidoreductase [bacterium]
MKVLVTGASSGIGLEISKYLLKGDNELILVAKDKNKLKKIQEQYNKKIKIIVADLSNTTKVKELYILCKNENIDVLINNAGFGDCGVFSETDLNKDLNMINVNIKAVHVLTKLFLKDMKKRNSGYILNVSSMASFSPGPLMATYYATKAYVTRLTLSIYEELRREKSNVVISCLCPGPVNTNFNKTANVSFSIKQLDSKFVAEYAIENLFKRKSIIIPGTKMKLIYLLTKIVPTSLCNRISYKIQKSKIYK